MIQIGQTSEACICPVPIDSGFLWMGRQGPPEEKVSITQLSGAPDAPGDAPGDNIHGTEDSDLVPSVTLAATLILEHKTHGCVPYWGQTPLTQHDNSLRPTLGSCFPGQVLRGMELQLSGILHD
ncbi:hypothetical protein H671_6g15932 [Cricetulus griseus]|nr:hypothetical protein H671_6g15932 [Cricetulus griseus]